MYADLIDQLRGQRVTYTAPDPIGAAAFRYFATAIGDDNPLYSDGAFAREHGHGGVIAPPTLVCETNQYTGLSPDAEGFIGHAWGLEMPGSRLVRGGNSYTFYRPVHADDVLTVVWEVAEVTEKTGGAGQSMLVVESLATYTNQHGDLLTKNAETIIVTEIAGAAS